MNTAAPESLVNHEQSGMLQIRWQDGTYSQLAHALLRSRCQCAFCQKANRQRGDFPLINHAIRITAIHPLAENGLNLVFSDGHNRGIYPWVYLQQLAQEALV
jgi:DUF971 family protein